MNLVRAVRLTKLRLIIAAALAAATVLALPPRRCSVTWH